MRVGGTGGRVWARSVTHNGGGNSWQGKHSSYIIVKALVHPGQAAEYPHGLQSLDPAARRLDHCSSRSHRELLWPVLCSTSHSQRSLLTVKLENILLPNSFRPGAQSTPQLTAAITKPTRRTPGEANAPTVPSAFSAVCLWQMQSSGSKRGASLHLIFHRFPSPVTCTGAKDAAVDKTVGSSGRSCPDASVMGTA